MEKITHYLSIFTSSGTLICCALPALFVALGAGSVFASLISVFPALVWFSIYKIPIFIFASGMLLIGGVLQYNARNKACPIDTKNAEVCMSTRKKNLKLYLFSVFIYLLGAFFAFFIPYLF
jgi:hypothetical protein